MADQWYPVLNYEKCINCMACLEKCSHGAFDVVNSRAVVVNPVACVQGCHGCGNICSVGAIEYVGENTDWQPPANQGQTSLGSSCCSCDCGEKSKTL